MKVDRRTVLAAGIVLGAVAASRLRAAESGNPLVAFSAADAKSIRAVQISAGGGETTFTTVEIVPDGSPHPHFTQFLAHKARAVAVYTAPGKHKATVIPDGRQLMILLAGDLILRAGRALQRCMAGQMILLDPGAAHDHQAGPSGYTAVRIALTE
ncbi:MAG TPA: hypothetical protein VH722_16030 [Alphaproteobacteria bacterium]|jgi:quercetin dioxygenase-like cupin family protein|nr:hypothetical protein [Alphaproteobacteria bacterium]